MTEVVPINTPMRADVFEATVKDRAKFSHEVIITDHIKDAMAERSITQRQILNVLQKGTAVGDSKRNPAQASYEGIMKYRGSGREISVVCAVRKSEVTVYAVTTY